jgi:sialic acid synthase SpsE
MAAVVKETERAWQSLGKVTYGPTEAEQRAVTRRRSLYITRDLRSGAVLTKDNLRAIRPGYGLPPKYLDQVLGMKITKDVPRGTPLSWDMFK